MAAAGLVAEGGDDGDMVALSRRKLNGPDPEPRFPLLGMMMVLDGFLLCLFLLLGVKAKKGVPRDSGDDPEEDEPPCCISEGPVSDKERVLGIFKSKEKRRAVIRRRDTEETP